jgi:hypothetical protein
LPDFDLLALVSWLPSPLQLNRNSVEKAAARCREGFRGVIDLSSIPVLPIV